MKPKTKIVRKKMKKLFLVINENEDSTLIPYKLKYVLFERLEAAMSHAISIGWKDPYNLGIGLDAGRINTYLCGEINVSILCLESHVG